jgi:hypothetical protein
MAYANEQPCSRPVTLFKCVENTEFVAERRFPWQKCGPTFRGYLQHVVATALAPLCLNPCISSQSSSSVEVSFGVLLATLIYRTENVALTETTMPATILYQLLGVSGKLPPRSRAISNSEAFHLPG